MSKAKKEVIEFPGFESLDDLDRNVTETIEDMDIPGEYRGTIRITIEYLPADGEE
jgi:hypothetical protein